MVWLDDRTLVTSSTDNTLRLWDAMAPHAPHTGTLSGHTNHKHFVGLSVAPGGHIACGSEDNAVVAYHRATPAPAFRHPFVSRNAFSSYATGTVRSIRAPPFRSSSLQSPPLCESFHCTVAALPAARCVYVPRRRVAAAAHAFPLCVDSPLLRLQAPQGQFVSAVCWRQDGEALLAASSSGVTKVLIQRA